MRRIAILCEVMSPPFDEGIRIVASRLACALSGRMEVALLGSEDAQVNGLEVHGVLTDRYFMGGGLARALSKFMPQALLYIPWTSLTARTLFRVGVLGRRAPGIPIGVLALQPRGAGRLSRLLARFGRPDRLFALGPEVERDGLALDLSVCRLTGGVDTDRFKPRGGEPLGDLRRSLGLPVDPWLVLHVGHLKESRGVMALASVQAVEGVQTLLMASSSTDQEPGVRKRLQESGVRVFEQYAENIQEYYLLSRSWRRWPATFPWSRPGSGGCRISWKGRGPRWPSWIPPRRSRAR
jgi:hypothetical protein